MGVRFAADKKTPQASRVRPWLWGLLAAAVIAVLAFGGARLARRIAVRKTTASQSPVVAPPAPPSPAPLNFPAVATLRALRYSSKAEFTALELDLNRPVQVRTKILDNPKRLYFDLMETHVALGPEAPATQGGVTTYAVDDPLISRIRVAQKTSAVTRVVLDLNCACTFAFVKLQDPPYRLVIDVEAPRDQATKMASH